jgi:hypothetical protein
MNNLVFVPAKRFSGEEEIVGLVLYLATKAGAYYNGVVLANERGRLGVTVSTYYV